MYTPSTQKILEALQLVPYGMVASYGQIASLAGYPNGARQVVRILSSLSDKEALPWHRIVNSTWRISLKGDAYWHQRHLLEDEGVIFINDRVRDEFHWHDTRPLGRD